MRYLTLLRNCFLYLSYVDNEKMKRNIMKQFSLFTNFFLFLIDRLTIAVLVNSANNSSARSGNLIFRSVFHSFWDHRDVITGGNYPTLGPPLYLSILQTLVHLRCNKILIICFSLSLIIGIFFRYEIQCSQSWILWKFQ